jgi:subtilisin family serine protease
MHFTGGNMTKDTMILIGVLMSSAISWANMSSHYPQTNFSKHTKTQSVKNKQSLASRQQDADTYDMLIKLAPSISPLEVTSLSAAVLENSSSSAKFESLGINNWYHVRLAKNEKNLAKLQSFKNNELVEAMQPNLALGLLHDFRIHDPLKKAAIYKSLSKIPQKNPVKPKPDNLEIPQAPLSETQGADPLYSHQWGMIDNKMENAWKVHKGTSDIVVAVIDTGVDYTHEDLLPNMWRNPGESGLDSQGHDKSKNGIDDDNNGYIDDIVGWDFSGNDNKPYDLSTDPLQMISKGGNPGHGTHCAGNVAARGNNSKGISGVAPNAKIMAIRFIGSEGGGTTADAIKSIKYAVDNGAKVLSNSWGGEGPRDDKGEDNMALLDAVKYSMEKDTLFIVAAGNGRKGAGFNNDTDANPVYPSSYDVENLISVAAIDNQNQLGVFSNFGAKSVHIGAPGVKVYSTMVENKYDDTIFDLLGITATWDGTSMATPHVAGAAALYWSAHPEKTWRDVKNALYNSAEKIPALSNKVFTGGKLNVEALMNQ